MKPHSESLKQLLFRRLLVLGELEACLHAVAWLFHTNRKGLIVVG